MLIRIAIPEDAVEINRLISMVASGYLNDDITEEGEVTLRDIVGPETIVRNMESGDYVYFVAVDGSKIVGVSAIQGNDHLYHLFVAKEYQGFGLATRLWNAAKKHGESNGNDGRFTVYSSSYAVEFYQKLGFIPTGLAMWESGLRSTPMVWYRTGDGR